MSISFRSYKRLRNDLFRYERDNGLLNYNLYSMKEHRSLNILFSEFE